MANRPQPEVAITQHLVRALLQSQFPELATRELRELSRGWDNTNVLVGDDLLARLPHREVAAPLIINEQRWLPEIAKLVDMAIPAPTHVGEPTTGYPWKWSVTPFFAGQEAATASLSNPAATARRLGDFFRQLHVTAAPDAPLNAFRGCPLEDRRSSFEANLAHVPDAATVTGLRAVFDAGCVGPPAADRVWLHGDMHGRNMVVDDGDLVAIIDWGDICSGDRATDLAGAFMLVPEHVPMVMSIAGASQDDWRRAKGWAANFAAVYLAHSDDDPVMGDMGNRLVGSLLSA